MRTLEDIMAALPAATRKKVRARAKEMIAEQLTLQQLRRAQDKTQAELAKDLRLTQDQISRMEKRGDLYLSTLRKYVGAIGGELSLIAILPGKPAVNLIIADADRRTPRARRVQKAASVKKPRKTKAA